MPLWQDDIKPCTYFFRHSPLLPQGWEVPSRCAPDRFGQVGSRAWSWMSVTPWRCPSGSRDYEASADWSSGWNKLIGLRGNGRDGEMLSSTDSWIWHIAPPLEKLKHPHTRLGSQYDVFTLPPCLRFQRAQNPQNNAFLGRLARLILPLFEVWQNPKWTSDEKKD